MSLIHSDSNSVSCNKRRGRETKLSEIIHQIFPEFRLLKIRSVSRKPAFECCAFGVLFAFIGLPSLLATGGRRPCVVLLF